MLRAVYYYSALALLHLSKTKSVSSGSSSVRLASSRCEARSSTVGLPHPCEQVRIHVNKVSSATDSTLHSSTTLGLLSKH